MKIIDLLKQWNDTASESYTHHEYAVRLPLHDAARIRALAEMYPGRTETQIITDLLNTALNELEEALPYVQGNRVVTEDELGDPIYEDTGPTPRFKELTQKHIKIMKAE